MTLLVDMDISKASVTFETENQHSFNIDNIVKLGVQELLSLGSLSSSTKDKLSRSPLDPWSLKL